MIGSLRTFYLNVRGMSFMTSSATPKRPLEADEHGSLSEGYRWKRLQHDALSSVFASQSSSQSSCGRSSSVRILSDGVQHMVVDSEEEAIEAPQRNHLLPLAGLQIQGTSDYLLPQVPPSTSMDGVGSQEPDARKKEQICFGMVRRMKSPRRFVTNLWGNSITLAQLRCVQIRMNSIQSKELKLLEELGREKDILASLDLIFGQDRCDLQFNCINVATMNSKSQRALYQLMSLVSKESVRYEALVPRAEFREKLEAAAQPLNPDKFKLICSMDVLIFGARYLANTIAKELCKYRMFLQHPTRRPLDVAYENPQYLSAVGSSFTNGAILPPISTEASQNDIKSKPNIENPDQDPDELKVFINNLPGHDYLQEADVDKRIETNLLRHQKIAVDFIVGRESNQDESPRMLWRVDDFTSGVPRFRHKITGARSQTPDDILGGILADDMGLGKTLTMIATIITTISRAEHFATTRFTDEEGIKDSRIPVMPTLVIVPSVLLLNGWIDEITKHVHCLTKASFLIYSRHITHGTLQYYVYHGPDRRLSSSSALPYHIVFSTYGTVAADLGRGGSVLDCFHWYRLILDEAHTIRNSSTKSFKAVMNLSANIRWCITGTPVQNSLHDLGSLIKFLRVPQLDDTSAFRRHIARNQKTGKDSQRPKPDYENLKMLLGSICLRRSISSLSLGVTYLEKYSQLSKVEKRTYNELAKSCELSIKAMVGKRRSPKGSRALLTALLRLRIFCNTGLITLTQTRVTEEDSVKQFYPDKINSLFQQIGRAVCSECNCDIISIDTIDGLDQQLVDPSRRLKCHDCKQQITASYDSGYSLRGSLSPVRRVNPEPIPLQKEDSGYDSGSNIYGSISGHPKYPSKLKAVLSNIMEHHAQEKSIVFSTWKRSIDLMAQLLHQTGIVFGQVDGTLPSPRRKEVLEKFHHDSSVKVLLMTLGIGAAGLNNLSVASRVYILEPQWNPSVEDQAVGRILRLGQDKQVYVVRYVTSGTIEESVRSRQLMKIQLTREGGLQELSEIIKSTVFTEVPTAAPQVEMID